MGSFCSRSPPCCHEGPGAERASTYTQARFPEASIAAIRLYAASCSYRSAAASSASVISNTVPLTRLSFLLLNSFVSMMRLAACSHDLRVLDPYQRLLEPEKLVPLPFEQPSER